MGYPDFWWVNDFTLVPPDEDEPPYYEDEPMILRSYI